MATADELREGVNTFFSGEYSVTKTRTVPEVSDLAFNKTGKESELAMMFIDLRGSTTMVAGIRRTTAARMYKSLLWGVARIARSNSGDVRSFNGDGVLIAFSGDSKCTNAAKAAMQMAWYVSKVLKPKMLAIF